MPEPNQSLFGAWGGRNKPLPVSDDIDLTRTDLVRIFEAAPRARHDLEVQLLASGVRGSRKVPRLVLVRIGEQQWRIARVAEVRGGEPELYDREFDDKDDAERYVMNLRLSLLTESSTAGADSR